MVRKVIVRMVMVAVASASFPAVTLAQLAGLNTAGSQVTGTSSDFLGLSGSTTGGVSVLTNSASVMETKLGMNVNADAVIFLATNQTGNATHRVSFTASSPTPYRVTIDTRLRGDLNLYNDLLFLPCDASANISGVSGTSSVPLSGGTLTIADPGTQTTTGTNTSLAFNTTAQATIDRPAGGTISPTLTFTFNGQASSASCESAVRVGAQNGTTTDCLACGYPGAPSRNQNEDGHFVAIRFTALAGSCGDMILEPTEQCDLGASNGQPGQCCSASCQLVPPAVTCTAGSAGGSCGDNVTQAGEQCDLGAQNGQSGVCCSASCQFSSSATACRAAIGSDECDVSEFCTGTSASCPSDTVRPPTFTCRAETGPCDSSETCSGSGKDCPADAMQPSTAICRAQNGACDVAERCTGSSASCPADGFASSGTVCRSASTGGSCDATEVCTGSSASCPADAFKPAGTPCGSSSDTACDNPDTCNAGGVCSANTEPNGTPCGSAVGSECDLADTCSSGVCQSNVRPAGTACSDDGLPCTRDECNGAGSCAHPPRSAGTVCRASAGACDVAETCNGVNGICPADGLTSAGTTCRAAAGVCDVAEACTGSSASCPADAFTPSATVCRSASTGGVCDAAESCSGSSASCPADGFLPNGATCDDDNPLTSGDQCVMGQCEGEGGPTSDAACPDSPSSSCLLPIELAAARLKIRYDNANPDSGLLKWSWKKGAATAITAFGNPLFGGDTSYAFCLYLDGQLLYESTIPTGFGWSSSARGPKFKDRSLTHEGMSLIGLKSGPAGKSKITVKARARNLTPLHFSGSTVEIRLHNNHDMCWGADFGLLR